MPLLTIEDLTVDGVVLPQPLINGFSIKPEKVWSKNTGRTAAVTMVGTILDIKTTVDIKWPALPVEKVELIEQVVSNKDRPFVPMSFTDQTGARRTMTVYFGTPTYNCFSWVDGEWRVTDLSVSAVEQ